MEDKPAFLLVVSLGKDTANRMSPSFCGRQVAPRTGLTPVVSWGLVRLNQTSKHAIQYYYALAPPGVTGLTIFDDDIRCWLNTTTTSI